MSNDGHTSKNGMMVPFILVILSVSFLILVSDYSHPNEKPKEETKTGTPAH